VRFLSLNGADSLIDSLYAREFGHDLQLNSRAEAAIWSLHALGIVFALSHRQLRSGQLRRRFCSWQAQQGE
jgi:hypothetical protein